MVVTPLPELLSKSSLLQGGRKEDSSWFVLRNHLLALSFKDNVNACLLLRSTILLACCSTMHHVGVDSDDNGLNLLSTTQCLSASVCKVIGAPAAHRQSLPFLYDVNLSGKERRKLKSRTRPMHGMASRQFLRLGHYVAVKRWPLNWIRSARVSHDCHPLVSPAWPVPFRHRITRARITRDSSRFSL